MWRSITRGLQQSLKKNACFDENGQILRRTSASCRKCCISELIPGAFRSLKQCSQKLEDENNKHQENYEKTRDRPVNEHSFLEAFGWSGALVFAWVISKQWWMKYKWAHESDTRWQAPCRSPTARCPLFDQSIVRLLAQIVKTQPPVSYVLPQLKQDSTHLPQLIETKPTLTTYSKDNDDDDFEAAAENLRQVHEKAIAEALNRRGIACLSKASGTEAISFFQRAAELKYPPASFNMGQCCELGIGTEQDFKKAAEWYVVASEQGHATAKYNLGVFYAHGWGGLVADISAAKRLFVEAAKLGQPDAIAALDKEPKYKHTGDCKPANVQPDMCNNYTQIPKLNESDWNILLNNLMYNPSGEDAIKRTIELFKSRVH